MRNALNSTRNFVAKHKVGIAVVTTSACWIAINMRAMKQHNEFLKEHGLYDEFYSTEEI